MSTKMEERLVRRNDAEAIKAAGLMRHQHSLPANKNSVVFCESWESSV